MRRVTLNTTPLVLLVVALKDGTIHDLVRKELHQIGNEGEDHGLQQGEEPRHGRARRAARRGVGQAQRGAQDNGFSTITGFNRR